MASLRILIHTLPPAERGVPQKAAFLAHWLKARGHEVGIVHTLPHGGLARPGVLAGTCFDGIPCTAIGGRLPDTGLLNYLPSARWRTAMAGWNRHVAVGDDVLVAYRLVERRLPHLVWCDRPVLEGRMECRRRMAALPRILDGWVTVPLLERLERAVLDGSNMILPISSHTAGVFRDMGRLRPQTVLPVPVDPALFHPPVTPALPGMIGVAGEAVGLVLEALALLKGKGVKASLHMAAEPSPEVTARIEALALSRRVSFAGTLSSRDLPAFYRGLDVFAMPPVPGSLHVAAGEAAASGLPVVTTRDGGGGEYVRDGESGFLVGTDAADIAGRLERLIADRALRARMGAAARRVAEADFSIARWERTFTTAWRSVWGESP